MSKGLLALSLLLLTIGCGSGGGRSDKLSINPNCGREYAAVAGQPIEIYYGAWGALGPELTEENAAHLTVEFEVDGQIVAGHQEPVMTCQSALQYFCKMGPGTCSDGSSWIIHRATLDPLTPGDHDVTITHTFDQRVSDGYDSNDDGEVDTFGPGVWTRRQYLLVAK